MYKFVKFFRHMTFVFLQLGEVLFVDLRLKMMVASVEVKESIKSLELMQDKQHETTALLVNILPFFISVVIIVSLGNVFHVLWCTTHQPKIDGTSFA